MVPHAVADAVGIGIEGGTASLKPLDVLLSRLASQQLLLVLDNCEHVIDAVASVVEAMLARCAEVRIVTTSREALAVPGEAQLPVQPLPVPEPSTPAGEVPTFPAARLFLDRAEAVAPGSLSAPDDLLAAASICRRLDGIPLALELAAARLTTLTPVELAERVVNRFDLLTGGSRTADARQRTLRQTVDWSYNLLAPAEQLMFRRLAVFHGGWTLPAAEGVLTGPELPASMVFERLERLVQQSLVVAEPVAGHTRYRMLETLRQYAEEQLERAGEADAVARRHALHYVGLGEQAETGLRGASQAHWVSLLREEHANFRAALAWLTGTDGHTDEALRLAGSLGLYWHMGRHLEGRESLRSVMALPGGSPDARARALQAVSLVERPRACIVHPSEQCAAAAQESLDIFERIGDRPRAAFSRLLLAVEGVGASSRVDGPQLLDHAERDFAALGDDWGRAVVAFVRMETLAKRGDEASARRAAADAIGQFRTLGDGWGLSAVLYHFGYGLQRFGRYDEAVAVLEEAIDVAREAGVYNTVQWATSDLGLALLSLGRIDEAASCFRRAGAVSDQVGDHAGAVLTRYGEAVLAQQAGQHETARPLFAEALRGFEKLGVWLATGLALAGVAACDEALGDRPSARHGYRRLLELGEKAGEVGLVVTALEGLARNSLVEDPVHTAELLGRAESMRRRYDRPATAAERSAVEETITAASAVLGPRGYREAAQRGAAEWAQADRLVCLPQHPRARRLGIRRRPAWYLLPPR